MNAASTILKMSDLAYPLRMFKGKFSEANEMMERTWNNMLYSLQKEGLRQHFTPQEMQLALADLQVHFTYAVMDYAMYHEDAVRKYEQRDGRYQMVILDSLEWNKIYDTESYKAADQRQLSHHPQPHPVCQTCQQAKVQRVAG